jgi:predicted secreted hydrolase
MKVNKLGSKERRIWLRRAAITGSIVGAQTSAAQNKAKPVPTTDAPHYGVVDPTTQLRFPLDYGAHPLFRTEWWYLSAWLKNSQGREFGLQITFFRTRTAFNLASTSAFAPRQIILAHMAIADPQSKNLFHDQRSARESPTAFVKEGNTACQIQDWRLERLIDDTYEAKSVCNTGRPDQWFSIALRFAPTGSPVLQGRQGFSQKGPQAIHASHYYSRPQLKANGEIQLQRESFSVTGTAWLDHEWSSTLLADDAIGWDWIGVNLNNGGSLLAFQLRSPNPNAPVWTHVVIRDAQNKIEFEANGPNQLRFTTRRSWRSTKSGATYPVEQELEFGPFKMVLIPLFDAQEIDGRQSTGGFYWEGAIRVFQFVDRFDPQKATEIGRGYLEMTGYAGRIRLGQ